VERASSRWMIDFVVSRTLILICSVLALISCDEPAKLFIKHGEESSNITFANHLSPTSDLNILSYLYYYNGGGVSAGDFNNDGLVDLFFTGNQVGNKLYLNQGNFEFADITAEANLGNDNVWSTGVTHVDINNDGLLDIYVCVVGNYSQLKGANRLYVNKGVNAEGVPIFEDMAKEYGLDFSGFSTQSVFFDYDVDGDLDMFLLNHSIHPNRSYGVGEKRRAVDSLSGDRLFRNDDEKFTDVSDQTGIFQGGIGYGLGVSASDFNADGYPDLYVGNDFFENDYLYLNNTDGSFTEVISSDEAKMGHTSHYSMGNTVADLDNDGRPDILSLDMLPENLETFKASGTEYSFPIYNNYLKNGYAPQYMQNTLHLNRGNGSFSEVAHLAGIAATEWSWAVLAADLDMDGFKDLYISNGIKGATNDMDFISFIAQDEIQRKLNAGMGRDEMSFIEQIPEKKIRNYSYKNLGNSSFDDVSDKWFNATPSFSNGAVYADLDNDGDLDIIVNNINEVASLFENTSDQKGNSYLKVEFEGSEKNARGIGAKVQIVAEDLFIYEENFPTRTYLSSVPASLTVGLGNAGKVDSLTVIWPDGRSQTMVDVAVNDRLTLRWEEANLVSSKKHEAENSILSNTVALFDFEHVEEACLEFEREPLIPFAKSNEGPKVSVADINGDGLDDVFVGGAKRQAGELFIQNQDGFIRNQSELFEKSHISEDTDQVFFDADLDGDMDLLVVSGGNEFRSGAPLQPRLYRNEESVFVLDTVEFSGVEVTASVIRTLDLENDGDLDVVIGSGSVPREFGSNPVNYIFTNTNGHFEDVSTSYGAAFSDVGQVEDIAIVDLDKNGYQDMVVVGHWIPISIFLNNGTDFVLAEAILERSNGWWNSVVAKDFDQDGDLDIVAGNWGLNTRLKASYEEPVNLYRNDFDDNGSIESIVTYHYQGKETTLASKDELTKQLPILNKKYLSYQSFATADFGELFSKEKLSSSEKRSAYELASCYFENQGDNTFKKRRLPFEAQVSSIHALEAEDFDGDGFLDLFLAGNSHQISTQLGRLDASHGTLLLNDRNGFFKEGNSAMFDVPGQARDIEKIQVGDADYYIVSINNGKPIFLKGIQK